MFNKFRLQMFTRSILLLIGVLQWYAQSALLQRPNDRCLTESGITYTIGSIFTDHECSTKCKCLDDGIISCQPMCFITKTNNSCAKQKIVYTPVGLPDAQGKSCSCPSFICEPDFCSDGGKTYNPGDNFIAADCSKSCRCLAGGNVACVSLCPPTFIQCNANEVKIKTSRKIANSACLCPEWKCMQAKQQKVQAHIPALTIQRCSDGGKTYRPGDRFISSDCTGSCRCRTGGNVGCVSLCPPVRVKCLPNEKQIKSLRQIPNSNCTCPYLQCVKRKAKVQVTATQPHMKQLCVASNGKIHTIGQEFTDMNCSSRCRCNDGGVLTCEPLCMALPKDNFCAEKNIVHIPVRLPDAEGRRCSCPLFLCGAQEVKEQVYDANDFCYDGKNKYKPGDRFISADCHGSCVCGRRGGVACVSVCPPKNKICKMGEEKIEYTQKIANSSCTCPAWKCVQKKEFCEVLGGRYKVGEYFESKDCSGYCRCNGPTSFGCVSLCPPHGIYCIPGTRKVRTVKPAFTGSNCTCPSWKCVKVENMWRPWSNWTDCDAECGGGLRYRFRTCIGNEICSGPRVESQVCNVAPCSSSYSDAPCGALRINSAKDDIWPRCDDRGYFEPLQCEPSKSECWCVNRWGDVQPGSRRISEKPKCSNSNIIAANSQP